MSRPEKTALILRPDLHFAHCVPWLLPDAPIDSCLGTNMRGRPARETLNAISLLLRLDEMRSGSPSSWFGRAAGSRYPRFAGKWSNVRTNPRNERS